MITQFAAHHPVQPELSASDVLSTEVATLSILALVLVVVSLVSGITGVGILAGICALTAAGIVIVSALRPETTPTTTD